MGRSEGLSRGLVVLLLVGGAAGVAAVLAARRPDPDDVYEQALAALEAGRIDAAESRLARLTRLRSPTVLDWGIRARVAIARERTDAALAALARIPDGHALAGWARLRAGQLELRRRHFRAAETALRAALAREPGLIDARRELVFILGLQLRRPELDEQFRHLAAAGALAPHEVWVWCMSRDLVWWTPEEQAAFLESALKADPDDRWSRLALATARGRQGVYAAAEALLQPLARADPFACAERARLALQRHDPEAAAAVLAEGPAGHPALAPLRGRLALGRGDADAAVRELERAEAAEPGRRRVLADLGHAYIKAGAPEKAQSYLDTAARIDALHNLLLSVEERIEGSGPDLWSRLGSACEVADRASQARAWYGLIVARDPLDQRAQRALYRLDAAGPRKQPAPAQSASAAR